MTPGEKFSHLTAIQQVADYIDSYGYTHEKWLYRCECGNDQMVKTSLIVAALEKDGWCSCFDCYKRHFKRSGFRPSDRFAEREKARARKDAAAAKKEDPVSHEIARKAKRAAAARAAYAAARVPKVPREPRVSARATVAAARKAARAEARAAAAAADIASVRAKSDKRAAKRAALAKTPGAIRRRHDAAVDATIASRSVDNTSEVVKVER